MSEYANYNDKIFESSHNNSFQDQNNSQGQFIDFNNNFSFSCLKVANIEYQQKIEKHKEPLLQTNLSNSQAVQVLKSFNQIRETRIINCNHSKKKSYLQSKKGCAEQTIDLNINFKTIVCRFIKDLAVLKLLTKAQKQLFLSYKSQGPSFQSLNKFIHNKQNNYCRKQLLNIVENSQIIRCIISSNVQIKNKLKMIKFVQIIRKTIHQPKIINKWKVSYY